MTRSLDTKIWTIAWPAIVSNISVPLLGLVDAALLGHLDSPLHLAAVAMGGAVLSFLYWGFGFLRMGTTGEVARASGAANQTAAVLALCRAALLALAIAVLLLLIHRPVLHLGLAIMDPEPAVADVARNYATLRLLSAPAVLLTYALLGWFIGRQTTRWAMRVVISTNLANIALDALFIAGFGWASRGAALATVSAEYIGLAIGLWALRQQLPPVPGTTVGRSLRQLQPYLAVLASNLQLFLRTLTLLAAFAFFTAASENLGQSVLAANSVMIQFLLFAAFALDGFAYAAEGLGGAALGAGDRSGFHRVAARCGLWTGVGAATISLLILAGRPLLLPLLSDIDSVQAVLRAQSSWLVVLPLLAAPSYLFDGLFIGAGATRAMMVTMLGSALLVYLPVWALSRGWGNDGLWLAFTLFNAARGLGLGGCYLWFRYRGPW